MIEVVDVFELPIVVVETMTDETGVYFRAKWGGVEGKIGPWMRSTKSAILRLLADHEPANLPREFHEPTA